MRELTGSKDRDAAYVAQLYFAAESPLTQTQIAASLDVNKSTISRLIRYALESGIADVAFELPREQHLEVRLTQKYGLIDAVVVPIAEVSRKEQGWHFRKQLAQAGARHLDTPGSPIRENQCVGIGCGKTIRDLIMALRRRRLPGMSISQLTVEVETQGYIDCAPFSLACMLLAGWRDESNGEGGTSKAYAVHPLPGTLRKGSALTKEYKPHYDEMMSQARDLDVAILGIGSLGRGAESGTYYQILKNHGITRAQLSKANAVGEICNRPYDAMGRDVASKIKGLLEIVDGVELSLLQHLTRRQCKVIAVAGGPPKVRAIRIALENHFINYLITDTATAAKLCGKEKN